MIDSKLVVLSLIAFATISSLCALGAPADSVESQNDDKSADISSQQEKGGAKLTYLEAAIRGHRAAMEALKAKGLVVGTPLESSSPLAAVSAAVEDESSEVDVSDIDSVGSVSNNDAMSTSDDSEDDEDWYDALTELPEDYDDGLFDASGSWKPEEFEGPENPIFELGDDDESADDDEFYDSSSSDLEDDEDDDSVTSQVPVFQPLAAVSAAVEDESSEAVAEKAALEKSIQDETNKILDEGGVNFADYTAEDVKNGDEDAIYVDDLSDLDLDDDIDTDYDIDGDSIWDEQVRPKVLAKLPPSSHFRNVDHIKF